jgi:intracellular multiplication protein IcmE
MSVPDASNFTQRVNASALQRTFLGTGRKPNNTFAASQYAGKRVAYFNNRNLTPAILQDMSKITTVEQFRTLEDLFIRASPSQVGTTLTLNGKLPDSAFVGGTVMQDVTATTFKMAYIAPDALIDVSKILPLSAGDVLIFPVSPTVSVVLWDGINDNTKTTLSTDGTNLFVQGVPPNTKYLTKTSIPVGYGYTIGTYSLLVYGIGSLAAVTLTAEQQRLRGLTLLELRTTYAGLYTDYELLRAGYNLYDMKAAGYGIGDVYSLYSYLNYGIPQYLAFGFTRDDVLADFHLFDLFDLKQQGFTAEELAQVGVTIEQFAGMYNKKQYISYTESQLTQAGFSDIQIQQFRADFQRHGFSDYTTRQLIESSFFGVNDLLQAGYPLYLIKFQNPTITASDFRAAGLELDQLISAGCTPLELSEANYTISELFDAGLSVRDIYTGLFANDVITELLFRGITITTVYQRSSTTAYNTPPSSMYIITREKVQNAGIDLTDPKVDQGLAAKVPSPLELAKYVVPNFTLPDLFSVGYILSELRGIKFTKGNYATAGITIGNLRTAGWTVADIDPSVTVNSVYYSVTELKNAGYTAREFVASNKWTVSSFKNNIGFTAQELKAEGFSASEIKPAGYTASEVKLAGYSFSDAKAAKYSAVELKAGGYSDTDILAGGFLSTDLKAAGYSALQLKAAGYSFSDAKSAGYTASQLKIGGYSDADILAAGFLTTDLRAAGYTAIQVKNAGYAKSAILGAGYPVLDLKNAGYTAVDLKAGGYSDTNILGAGFTSTDLKAAGYSALQLKAAGYSLASLVTAGYDQSAILGAGYPISDLKNAGYSAVAVKSLGMFSDTEILGAGFTSTDLKAAGYSALQLKTAGYTVADLKDAGYDKSAVIGAGYPISELYFQGYADTVAELKLMGYLVTDLLSIGYTVSQLRVIGFVAADFAAANISILAMYIGGFTAFDLKGSSYADLRAIELVNAGYTMAQLYAAGIGHTISNIPYIPTVQQMFAAGWNVELPAAAGYSPYAIKIGGYSASDILNEGYGPNDMNPPFDLVDLRLAEITVQQFYENGRPLSDVYNAGYPVTAVVGTGYLMTSGYRYVKATYIDRMVPVTYEVANMVDLANAGYSPEQIVYLPTNVVLFIPYIAPEAGGIAYYVSPKSLGCPVKVLYYLYKQLNSFTPARMKNPLGYTAVELRLGGYTAADLKLAPYTVLELYQGGYNAAEMRAAGFTALDISGTWDDVDQLYLAGYTLAQMSQAQVGLVSFRGTYWGSLITVNDVTVAGFSSAEIIYWQTTPGIPYLGPNPPVLKRYGE